MRKKYHLMWTATLLVVFLSISNATTYYVNASTGNNANNGTSSATAFKTITKALSVSASSGDSIKVAPGTYDNALGETFPIEMLTGRKLIGTAGAVSTIIDATGSGNRVVNCNGNSNSTIIQGFTITGGYAIDTSSAGKTGNGGGLFITNGSFTIVQQNIIKNNIARGYDFYQAGIGALNGGTCYGGAMYISGSSPTIRNNVISDNIAQAGGGKDFRGGWSGNGSNGGNADGGGIYAAGSDSALIINNTFYGNKAIGGHGGSSNSLNAGFGGNATSGALNAGSNAIVKNNIFCNNAAIAGPTGGGSNGSDGSSINGAVTGYAAGKLSYNLYFNNTALLDSNGVTIGTNNILSDPMFVSSSNFHFSTNLSPAYHAGTSSGAPLTDLEGTTRSGTAPSIGAFEGVDPSAVLTLSPPTYRKDTVAVGDSSVQKYFIKNTFAGDLTYQGISTKTVPFIVVGSTSGIVKSNDSVSFTVVFKPNAFSEFLDTLTFTSVSGQTKYPLSGYSPSPALLTSLLSLDFGNTYKDSTVKKTIVLKNNSINKLRIDSIRTRSKQFTVTVIVPPLFLTKKDSSVLTLSFKPDSIRSFVDTLLVYSNQQKGIVMIPLSGKGNSLTSALRTNDPMPAIFELKQNYPNPFNPTTVIGYQLAVNSHVSLKVYDAIGREVAVLVNETKASGLYFATFEAKNYASGIYFTQLLSDGKSQIKKMLLLK